MNTTNTNDSLNERELFIAALTYQHPPRVPFDPGGGRKSTREKWHKQGLPTDINNYHQYVRQLIGIPEPPRVERIGIGVDFRMIPQFEEKIIDHQPGNPAVNQPGVLTVQDWKGNICRISDEYNVEYLRNAIDFVTRSWVKCPVENHADWEDMAKRYDIDHPGRFPDDFKQRAQKLHNRTYVSGINFSGPFWQLREWLGFENLCMLFIDKPTFAQEMIDFWDNFVAAMLERVFEHYVPDYVTISEDMAYKEKPMIGPDMARQFLLPCWKHWADICKNAGVPIIEMDSDGHAGLLIPSWIKAGINCNSPLEVAAGNDIVAYHADFGTKMSYRGGVDKRAMAKGGSVIENEIARLTPVIKAGGYIPSCDHGIPSDVSWPNFVHYCKLLAKATGWL